MIKSICAALFSVSALFCLSSCAVDERRPVEPQSNKSDTPWNKMEKFEQNAIFGPMERRR